jgi:hypothetical protein
MSKQRVKSSVNGETENESSRSFSLTSPRTLISIGVMLVSLFKRIVLGNYQSIVLLTYDELFQTTITALYLIWFTHAFHNELHNNAANEPQSTTKNILRLVFYSLLNLILRYKVDCFVG